MMLHELKPAQGATKAAKRKGRGHAWFQQHFRNGICYREGERP